MWASGCRIAMCLCVPQHCTLQEHLWIALAMPVALCVASNPPETLVRLVGRCKATAAKLVLELDCLSAPQHQDVSLSSPFDLEGFASQLQKISWASFGLGDRGILLCARCAVPEGLGVVSQSCSLWHSEPASQGSGSVTMRLGSGSRLMVVQGEKKRTGSPAKTFCITGLHWPVQPR